MKETDTKAFVYATWVVVALVLYFWMSNLQWIVAGALRGNWPDIFVLVGIVAVWFGLYFLFKRLIDHHTTPTTNNTIGEILGASDQVIYGDGNNKPRKTFWKPNEYGH